MNNNINLIAFGTFGNPNGFKQTFFIGNKELSKTVKTFDLNTNAIKLFPKANIYSIRKEYAGGHNIISYSVYSFAKEQNSERSGTFIGSSILFTGKIAEENITIKLLDEFQNNQKNKNVQNDTITVNHSDQLSVSKPTDFDKTEFNLKTIEDLNFIQTSNKNLVVYCETNPDKLQSFLKKSIDLLNVYDSIYFTQSKEVAEFVGQKGIFKLVQADGFEQEIQLLQAERNRKIESSISDFEKEISRLDEDKNKTLGEFREQIEKNEQLHQENEKKIRESKSDLEQVKQIYSDFSHKIKDYTNQLKSGRKLDDVKKLYNENKRIFIDSVQQIKRPSFINNISKAKTNTGLRNEVHYNSNNKNDWQNDEQGKREKSQPKFDVFKVTTLILSVLLLSAIAGLVYFQFFKKPEKEIIYNETQEEQIKQPIENIVSELNPKPNGEVDLSTKNTINTKLIKNSKIDSITNFVFKANPSSINEYYKYQKQGYSKLLFEKNKESFEINSSNDTVYIKDLQSIPNFKN